MFDGAKFGEDIVEIVRGYCEREIAPLKAENEVLKARLAVLESRPAPEKGDKGEAGDNGRDGRDGANGKDGRGIKQLLIDRAGELVATMDDGSLERLGPVVGKDGEPGKDGRDGFSLDDFDACVGEDDRTIEFKFVSGDNEHIVTMKWPTAIYRGVFSDGREYEQGDMVTWGGALWHCDTPTKDKPGTDSWTLAVKKGRDGRDSK